MGLKSIVTWFAFLTPVRLLTSFTWAFCKVLFWPFPKVIKAIIPRVTKFLFMLTCKKGRHCLEKLAFFLKCCVEEKHGIYRETLNETIFEPTRLEECFSS